MFVQKQGKNAQENRNVEYKLIGKPYQQINISSNVEDDIIPEKSESAFKNSIEMTDLELIIQPYFSENPPLSLPMEHFQLLATLSMTEHKNQLFEFIKMQTINYATFCSEIFLNLNSSDELIANCANFIPNIINASSYFSFLAQENSFGDIFYYTLNEKLIEATAFRNLLSTTVSTIIINSLSSNRQITMNDSYVIILADNSELYDLEIIQNHIDSYYQSQINDDDLKNCHCMLFQSFDAVYRSMPKDIRHLTDFLCEQFRDQVINNNISSFILHAGSIVINHTEMINTFFACIDPTTPIGQYKEFLQTIVNESVDLKKISKLHAFLGQQSTQMRNSLERFLKNRFLGNEKEVSRSFAELIDSDFRSGVYNPDFISELRMIPDKFEFQASHSNLMFRRAIETDFQFDRRFVHDASNLFDDNNLDHIRQIVEDVDQGKSIVKDYMNENNDIPSFLHIHLFSWKNWLISSGYAYKPPDILQPYLTSFAEYFKARFPKKRINWVLELSTCLLKLGKYAISCNGLTGTVLLSLNQSPKSASMIKEEINGSSKLDIDSILSQFVNEKGHTIIQKAYQANTFVYSINLDNRYGDSMLLNSSRTEITITTHLLSPQSTNNNQEINKDVLNIYSKNMKIDNIIIRILKNEKHIAKAEIVSQTIAQISFPCTEQIIQERINRLERQNFIAHDPMNPNIYNYVP